MPRRIAARTGCVVLVALMSLSACAGQKTDASAERGTEAVSNSPSTTSPARSTTPVRYRTRLPQTVTRQFHGVTDPALRPWRPRGHARMLAPCQGPLADFVWKSDRNRVAFVHELRGTPERNVTRQLTVYEDADAAKAFMRDLRLRSYGCARIGEREITVDASGEETLDPRFHVFDEVRTEPKRWQTADGDHMGAVLVVVREDNAVFLYQRYDADWGRGLPGPGQTDPAVQDALADARLLCLFDTGEPCDVDRAPALDPSPL